MDQHQREWNEKVAAKIIKNLEKRRMAGSYAADAARAKAEIVEMIPQGASRFSLWIDDIRRYRFVGGHCRPAGSQGD